MRALISPYTFGGTVTVPASKSHTIRRLLMASLCNGSSRIENPLESLDAQSCAAACRVLGAEITEEDGDPRRWIVRGRKPGPGPETAVAAEPLHIDVGNSGTTLFLVLAAAALGAAPVTFTGDKQIARRSAGPLLEALEALGAAVDSNGGCTPITVRGPWKGGRASISCPTSQYLSALLIAAPLAPAGVVSAIEVPLLNEKPYVDMTLLYLQGQGLLNTGTGPGLNSMEAYSRFRITGGAAYTPINGPVPGDFSSAAFPAAGAIISGGKLSLQGLDPEDPQGDKVFFDHLVTMGCKVEWEKTGIHGDGSPWQLRVSCPGPLRGGTFDLNATPDLLPVMAVLAAYAEGETALVNAAHARIKETDRIAVMAAELGKLGVHCREEPGGLFIKGAAWKEKQRANRNEKKWQEDARETESPVSLDGRGDHRIVMALACAALGLPARRTTEILGAEAADISYPGFLELLKARCYA
ncbi:MAG: 3-phosphoshikimate 1-carboxyvinyltransferase [Spirochaetaceae bacterium]|jgi:3-phosphoshikimate 1-carboxyvinyltransferase|nr:3-phosphoshikimate 1-carboxyvinyltransferase [Spirochaetaceae bacterium]